MNYKVAPYDHRPVGHWFLIGHTAIGSNLHGFGDLQSCILDDVAEHFVKHCLVRTVAGVSAVEGYHSTIVDEEGHLLVLVAWPVGEPFPAWHGCKVGFDALRPHVGDDTLVDLWSMEAQGVFDGIEMP